MRRFSSNLARTLSAVTLAFVALAAGSARADTVVRKDGVRLEGIVVSVDAHSVVIDTSTGTITIARGDVASVAFGGQKPFKVEIKNVVSDDAVDVAIDGDDVLRNASTGGEWIDITPKLKDGNNALRLRVHNARGVWAYRLILRVNGRSMPIECGTPQAFGKGCTRDGKRGDEIGVIEDLSEIWLRVDREAGRLEILP